MSFASKVAPLAFILSSSARSSAICFSASFSAARAANSSVFVSAGTATVDADSDVTC